MRIRKRKVPLPLSLLSPVPLDSNLFSRSPVTVQELEKDVPSNPVTTSQPSDHLGLTSSEGSASDLRRLILGVGNTDTTAPKQPQLFCFGISQGERKQEITDDARRGCMVALSQVDNGDTPPSSEATEWNWGDREREIPLKKRRASISATVVGPTSVADIKDERKDENALEEATKKGSKRRGNTIMEGSRCSRVNGRGWRCCQPTLVGYSLCEHHLGKGRLRSMTTVRGRPSKAAAAAQPQPRPNKASGVADGSAGKRVKLGVVKARSLSSLLGQPPNGNVHNGHLGLGVAYHHHVEINVINGKIDDNNADMVKEEP